MIHFPILVFDIETQIDLDAGAHLYRLNLPKEDIAQALAKIRRQESGGEFQKIPLHQIVCISGLWVDEQGFKLFSFNSNNASEKEILIKFLSIFEKRSPILISWNGSQFDLPVILFRAMYHGLSAPNLFDQGELNMQKRYNNYQNRYHHRHIDVMDVLAMFNGKNFQKLDEMACLFGLPRKRSLAEDNIGDGEWDVVTTWLIYLRWLLLKGQLQFSEHDQWIQSTIAYLQKQPRHVNFLTAWQKTSKQTDFTAEYFP